MPNFVEMAQTAADIWPFYDFQDGCRRHLGFVKFSIFNGQDGQEVRNASSCQISQYRLNRGRDMAIFFEISNFLRSQGLKGSNCIIMPNFVEIVQTAAEI